MVRTPYTVTAKKFWEELITTADPQADVSCLSMRELVDEGRNLSLMLARMFRDGRLATRTDSAERAKEFIDWHGLKLGLSHRKGVEARHGRPMRAHYGYVRGTYGQADDGMAYDVYVGPNATSKKVFKIDQLFPDSGEHDEYKYVLGATSSNQAVAIYMAHMPSRFYGGVSKSSLSEISPKRQDAGKRCGEGWIEQQDECAINARRDRAISRLNSGKSDMPSSVPVPPPPPRNIKGTQLTVGGFYPTDIKVAKLFHSGGPNRRKVREADPSHPSVQMNSFRAIIDKSRVNGDKIFGDLSPRHQKILKNSQSLIRGMTKAEHEAFKDNDPKFIDTYRHIYDEDGVIQMASIIGYSKEGTLNVHEMMTSPWNLSGAIKRSILKNAGLDGSELEMMSRQSSVNSADALESFLSEAETVRADLKAPGDVIVRCQPLKENVRWFTKAGMVHEGGKDYVLTVDAAKRFREKRMEAIEKMSRQDSSATDWYQELLQIEEETGGFMVSSGLAREDSVSPFESDFNGAFDGLCHLDSDDESIYPEDWIVNHFSDKLGGHVEEWVKRLGSWISSFTSLEQVSRALQQQPKAALDAMGSTDAFSEELSQSLYLADLEGRRTVLEDDIEELKRFDAFRAPAPAWLNLTFDEALNYFRNKTPVPATATKGLPEGYHDWAFSISGMTKADILKAAKWLIDRSIAEGMAFEEFVRQWRRLIGRRGWVPRGSGSEERRIYTIADTNYRGAFGAGRYEQMRDPDLLESRPYWLLRHRDSPNFRPVHKALHNHAIPATHSFWLGVRVPGGHGCRCAIYAVDEAIIRSRGYTIDRNPPHPHKFADPGFRSPFSFSAGGARAIAELKMRGNPFMRLIMG